MAPELQRYIQSHTSAEPELLSQITRYANLHLVNGRMCSGHQQGRLLKMLTQMIAPQMVLELGTYAGYSALCMAEGLKEGGRIITIEANDELEDIIRTFLAKSEHGKKVELLIGDAMEHIHSLADETFDMAFVDADKRDYPIYYKELKRIVKKGGYILADNTLWDGHVVESDSRSSQTRGIRKFNEMVVADNEVEVVLLPIRDGLSIIRLKTEGELKLLIEKGEQTSPE